MSFHIPVLIVPAVLAGTIAFTLAGYVSRQHSTALDTRGLIVFLLATGCASFLFVFIYLAYDVGVMLFLLNLAFTAALLGLLGLLHFSVVFADRRSALNTTTSSILAVCSVAFVVAIFTDRFHGTFRSDVTLYTEPVRVITTTYGPTGGIGLLYLLGLTLASAYYILVHLVRSETLYQKPGIIVAVAVVMPLVGSTLNFSAWPHPTVNLIPLFYTGSGLLYTLAVSRYDFLNVVPLAYEEVVNNIEDYVLITDSNGTVLTLNEPARRLIDESEPVGHSVSDVLPMDEPRSDGTGAPTSDGRPETEITVETRTGSQTLHVRSASVHARDGRFLGRAITLRDITNLKEREAELTRKNERLDQFASMVSHDLRNPLNVAQIRADLIDDDAEHVDEVTDALDRMETMIEKLLRLARAGQVVEETEQCHLEIVAKDAWTHVQNPESELRTDVEDTYVEADETRLLQLFENFFRNAIEHNDDPIVARVGCLDSGAGFYVEDDGHGIPADERSAIFEHGYTTNQSGSGLGLAIVTDIVGAHDWDITATDGSDGGARFEIKTAQP